MIIQCPNCGFSGRIPSYAVAVPHNARCPKCDYRFELSDLFSRMSPESAGFPDQPGDEFVEDVGDPDSSNYELKAIADVSPSARSGPRNARSSKDPWDEDADEGDLETGSQPGKNRSAAARSDQQVIPSPTMALVTTSKLADTWIHRMLQGWGILFLMWATFIAVRAMREIFLTGNGLLLPPEIMSSIVAVVLLVAGAACLFLLIDLGRYLRRLETQIEPVSARLQPPTAESIVPFRGRRLWQRDRRPVTVSGPGRRNR